MYNKDLTIFSVFHKAYAVPNCDFIKPIQVGKALTLIDLGFLKDDTGDNISVKNPTFCELTALYWIWKNLDSIDSKYIGLAHYRRYFTLPRTITKKVLFLTKQKKDKSDFYTVPLNEDALDEITSTQIRAQFLLTLNNNQLIVPRPTALGNLKSYQFNIKDHFIYHHLKEDWVLLENAIKKICPEYVEYSNNFFEQRREMYGYNMFIGSKEFVKNYCEWLFPILGELEQTAKLSAYPYQNRLFGFIAERLLNLYVAKNNIQTAPYPIIFFS